MRAQRRTTPVDVIPAPEASGMVQADRPKVMGSGELVRILDLPARVRADSPAAVLSGLRRARIMGAEEQRSLIARLEAATAGAQDGLQGAFTAGGRLSTGQMATLATALSQLEPAQLAAGERAGRSALLFWVRSEILGGGLAGQANALSWSDY